MIDYRKEGRLPSIHLKPISEEDLSFWAELLSQPEAGEHQLLKKRDREELGHELDYYGEENLGHPSHRRYKWVVIEKNSGEKVGVVSFDKLDFEHGIGRIGYTISRDFWGNGFATAAVGELTREIFTASNTERIEAECSVNNPASRRVLEKNGYRLEGIKRGYLRIHDRRVDHYSFGILRSDWEKPIRPQKTRRAGDHE